MNEPIPQNKKPSGFTRLSNRVSQLEVGLHNVGSNVEQLSNGISRLDTELTGQLDRIRTAVSESRTVNWGLIVSAILVIVSAMGVTSSVLLAYVSMSVRPLEQAQTYQEKLASKEADFGKQLLAAKMETVKEEQRENTRRIGKVEDWVQTHVQSSAGSEGRQWEQLNSLNREVFNQKSQFVPKKPEPKTIGQ